MIDSEDSTCSNLGINQIQPDCIQLSKIQLEAIPSGEEKIKQQMHRPKRSHKGQKCLRGKPLYYDEVKERLTISLTRTCIEKLGEIADEHELSRSEFLERLIRMYVNN